MVTIQEQIVALTLEANRLEPIGINELGNNSSKIEIREARRAEGTRILQQVEDIRNQIVLLEIQKNDEIAENINEIILSQETIVNQGDGLTIIPEQVSKQDNTLRNTLLLGGALLLIL